jgi:hypothetical protein
MEDQIRPLSVVEKIKPDGIVEYLEELLERARAGEIATVFTVTFSVGDSAFETVERGVRIDRLRMIGILECMKLDMMRAMDTDR